MASPRSRIHSRAPSPISSRHPDDDHEHQQYHQYNHHEPQHHQHHQHQHQHQHQHRSYPNERRPRASSIDDNNSTDVIVPRLVQYIEQHQFDKAIARVKDVPSEACAMISTATGSSPSGVAHNSVMGQGNLALHEACKNQPPLELIDALIEANESALKTKGQWGYLPLHFACCSRASPEVVARLIVGYPSATRTKDDHEGMLPLHLAAKWGADDEVLMALLTVHPRASTVRDLSGKLSMDHALQLSSPHVRDMVVKSLRRAPLLCSVSKAAMNKLAYESEAKLREVVEVYQERMSQVKDKYEEDKSNAVALEVQLRKELWDEKERSANLSDKVVWLSQAVQDKEAELEERENLLQQIQRVLAGFNPSVPTGSPVPLTSPSSMSPPGHDHQHMDKTRQSKTSLINENEHEKAKSAVREWVSAGVKSNNSNTNKDIGDYNDDDDHQNHRQQQRHHRHDDHQHGTGDEDSLREERDPPPGSYLSRSGQSPTKLDAVATVKEWFSSDTNLVGTTAITSTTSATDYRRPSLTTAPATKTAPPPSSASSSSQPAHYTNHRPSTIHTTNSSSTTSSARDKIEDIREHQLKSSSYAPASVATSKRSAGGDRLMKSSTGTSSNRPADSTSYGDSLISRSKSAPRPGALSSSVATSSSVARRESSSSIILPSSAGLQGGRSTMMSSSGTAVGDIYSSNNTTNNNNNSNSNNNGSGSSTSRQRRNKSPSPQQRQQQQQDRLPQVTTVLPHSSSRSSSASRRPKTPGIALRNSKNHIQQQQQQQLPSSASTLHLQHRSPNSSYSGSSRVTPNHGNHGAVTSSSSRQNISSTKSPSTTTSRTTPKRRTTAAATTTTTPSSYERSNKSPLRTGGPSTESYDPSGAATSTLNSRRNVNGLSIQTSAARYEYTSSPHRQRDSKTKQNDAREYNNNTYNHDDHQRPAYHHHHRHKNDNMHQHHYNSMNESMPGDDADESLTMDSRIEWE